MKKYTLSILFAMLSLATFAQHDYDNQGVMYSYGTDPHITVGLNSLIGTFGNQVSVLQLAHVDGGFLTLGQSGNAVNRFFMGGTAFGTGIFLDQNASFSISGGTNALKVHGSGINGGSVSIGVNDTPVGYKLAVGGKIIAEEIKVQLQADWPDFVFTKDYNLATLEEVEAQIQTKGHLTNIPSAAEVEESGISLGEMDAKLLQKVEELTLYMIELNKEVKTLKEENKKLKALLEK
ncbi:hypothetical protein [Kordia sp.]|uniref:hypothetical protein n=1 Tax=Kordia sp. TaxID=1965332 RepID=UPI003B5B434D